MYFNLETTCGKKIYEFLEEADMYPVSYAFVIVFNPSLNLDQISVVRSFNHTFKQLYDIIYLSEKMLKFFDLKTAKQLSSYRIVEW